MSDAASNFLELKILDHVLRGNVPSTYSAPGTVYVALFSDAGSGCGAALEAGTSSTSGTGNWGYYEVEGPGSTAYERQSVTFASAAAGSISSNITVTFPIATADYDTAGATGNVVTHLAIMDSSTGGNVLFYGALTTSKTVSSGDQFTISSGNLTVSLA